MISGLCARKVGEAQGYLSAGGVFGISLLLGGSPNTLLVVLWPVSQDEQKFDSQNCGTL